MPVAISMKAEEAERELSTGGYQAVRAHDGSLTPAFQPDSSRAQATRVTRAVLSVGLAVVLTCVACLLSARSQPDLQMTGSESQWQAIRKMSLPHAWSKGRVLHRQMQLENEKLPSLANVFQTPTPTGSIYNPHFSHDGVPPNVVGGTKGGVFTGTHHSPKGCPLTLGSGTYTNIFGQEADDCDGVNRGCDGILDSGKVLDICGVCGGDGLSCIHWCDGIPNSGNVFDECGVCGGSGISPGACDCDGRVPDVCGVCGGTGIPSEFCDCAHQVLDACNVCGGHATDATTCEDDDDGGGGECPSGTYGPHGGPCRACEQGKTSAGGSTAENECVCDVGFTGAQLEVGGNTYDLESCVPCAAGTYKDIIGSAQCRPCPANLMSLAGSAAVSDCGCGHGLTGAGDEECSACSAGTYKDTVGSEACVNVCPANSDSPAGSVAITDCTCNAGYTGANGGVCTACEAGTFKASSGSETCTECPQNAFSPPASVEDGACACNKGYTGIDCHACQAGKFKHVTGADGCVDCVAGKYSTSMGANSAHTCITCPADSTAPAGSPTEASCECNAGFIGPAGGPCVICKSGKYQVGGACVDCPGGLTSAPGSASSEDCLEVCPPGSFGPHGGPCEACEEGKFKAAPGSDPCVDQCPANTMSASGSKALTDCKCNAGYTADADGMECEACSAGSYKEERGSGQCEVCEAGTYSRVMAAASSDTCVTCPANSLSAAGSVSANDCVCSAGHTGPNGGTCEPCSPGTYKEEMGAGECTLCESGTYSKASGATSKDTCTLCSAVSSSKGAGSTTCECNAGYTGPDLGPCDPCPAGTYKDFVGSGMCVPCHDKSSSPAGSTRTTDCACNPGYTGTNGGQCTACAAGTFKATSGSETCTSCPDNTVSPPASVAESSCENNKKEKEKEKDDGDDDKRVTCNNKKTARASEPMSSDCAAELRNAKQNKKLDDLYARCRTALDFRKRCPQICW